MPSGELPHGGHVHSVAGEEKEPDVAPVASHHAPLQPVHCQDG